MQSDESERRRRDPNTKREEETKVMKCNEMKWKWIGDWAVQKGGRPFETNEPADVALVGRRDKNAFEREFPLWFDDKLQQISFRPRFRCKRRHVIAMADEAKVLQPNGKEVGWRCRQWKKVNNLIEVQIYIEKTRSQSVSGCCCLALFKVKSWTWTSNALCRCS